MKRKNRDEKILQIASAVWHLVAERGIRNVTLADIAKECGLSKGGLIHYFPTKNELLETTIMMFFERIFETAKEIRNQFSDPLQQILSYKWIFDKDNPDFYIGYRLFFDVMSIASQNPYYRKLFKNWVDRWIELLVFSIKKGIEQGLFRKDNPYRMARAISALYQGFASRWFLDQENHPTEWVDEYLEMLISTIVLKK